MSNQPVNNYLSIRQSGTLEKDSSYTISRNNSLTNVIGYIESGVLTVNFSGNNYRLKQGYSVLLPQNSQYKIYADKDNPPRFIWVNFRGKLIEDFIKEYNINEPVISQCDIKQKLTNVQVLSFEKKDNTFKIAPNIIKMVCDILDCRKDISPMENITPLNPYNEYEAYISNKIQDGFSVSEMAKAFFTSTTQINRNFKKYFNTTPYKYYEKIRLDISKSLIINTELTIEDISERLKFNNRNHFTSAYKKEFKISPSLDRKLNSKR